MAEHNDLGTKGEEHARAYLKRSRYEILEVNWRAYKYEIDLIAKKDDVIVFIEVKTRATKAFGLPEESINTHKEQHLMAGAEYYLNQSSIDLECRFDVIAITLEKGQIELRHIRNALG